MTLPHAALNLTDGLCASQDSGHRRPDPYPHSSRYLEYDNASLLTHHAPARRPQRTPGRLLKNHAGRVLRCGKNQAEAAPDAWLDESYVSRLLSGER